MTHTPAGTPISLAVVRSGSHRRLRAEAADPAALRAFDGTASAGGAGVVLEGPLSAANAAAVRATGLLRPVPLGLTCSVGVGDRLGVATPGHALAFRESGGGIAPVFAQQSAREMVRMSRSPQQVLDDATFGALEAGWQGPVGSDADHLKTVADLDECLQAGFTTFTIDAGDDVRDTPHPTDPIPWAALEDDAAALRRRYDDLVLDAGAVRITMSADDALAAAAKYGAAIVRTVELYRHLVAAADRPFEVELCLDETGVVTSPEDHVYLATELQRLGVRWNGFAPRFPGAFEKGVEYRGDPDELRASVIAHAALARRFGPYKLSVHSGSDKFGIYPMLALETDAVVHLKTSGTSYLVALEVAAAANPSLFRSIHRVSLAAYRTARASYHVTAGSVPDADALADSALPELVAAPASRQMLHVGYGAVLRNPDGGPSTLATELLTTLDAERDTYRRALADHIGRHLAPFAAAAN